MVAGGSYLFACHYDGSLVCETVGMAGCVVNAMLWPLGEYWAGVE